MKPHIRVTGHPGRIAPGGKYPVPGSVHLGCHSTDGEVYLGLDLNVSAACARQLAAELLAAAAEAEGVPAPATPVQLPSGLSRRTCDRCGQPSGEFTLCWSCDQRAPALLAEPPAGGTGSSGRPAGGVTEATSNLADIPSVPPSEQRGEMPEIRRVGEPDDKARQGDIPRGCTCDWGDTTCPRHAWPDGGAP